MKLNDTIAAIATPRGLGGIAIIVVLLFFDNDNPLFKRKNKSAEIVNESSIDATEDN